ncbi:MAG: hypothetical protein IPM29_22570 [Planctomycetes bacterium]|nr:hypothetical protein [Planctomycetota bacterium]
MNSPDRFLSTVLALALLLVAGACTTSGATDPATALLGAWTNPEPIVIAGPGEVRVSFAADRTGVVELADGLSFPLTRDSVRRFAWSLRGDDELTVSIGGNVAAGRVERRGDELLLYRRASQLDPETGAARELRPIRLCRLGG